MKVAHILLNKNTLSGLVFMGIGVLALALGRDLPVGEAQSMGPGYFPGILGWAILTLGITLLAMGVGMPSGSSRVDAIKWRPLLSILLAIGVFALTVERLGILLSCMSLIGLAALADRELRWQEIIVSAVLLSAFCAGVFVWGLGLPIPLVPW